MQFHDSKDRYCKAVPASILVPIPDGVLDQTAAAVMLKGMTAQYLIRRTCAVRAGETVLFHAAKGRSTSLARHSRHTRPRGQTWRRPPAKRSM
jgi:hypothetical protein